MAIYDIWTRGLGGGGGPIVKIDDTRSLSSLASALVSTGFIETTEMAMNNRPATSVILMSSVVDRIYPGR